MKKSIWQDKVIAIVDALFFVALIPTILVPTVPWATSLMTGLLLLVLVVCFATLRLKWAALTTLITALAWITILIRGLML